MEEHILKCDSSNIKCFYHCIKIILKVQIKTALYTNKELFAT